MSTALSYSHRTLIAYIGNKPLTGPFTHLNFLGSDRYLSRMSFEEESRTPGSG
jgi:hypothetical protein